MVPTNNKCSSPILRLKEEAFLHQTHPNSGVQRQHLPHVWILRIVSLSSAVNLHQVQGRHPPRQRKKTHKKNPTIPQTRGLLFLTLGGKVRWG